MNIFLCALSIAAGGFAGFRLGGRYKPPERFYKDMAEFLDYAANAIAVYKTPLPTVAEEYRGASGEPFAAFLSGYREYLADSDYGKEALKSRTEKIPLPEKEKTEIIGFFHMLGRYSEGEETARIRKFAEYCYKQRQHYAEMDGKYGKMILKLGFTAGAVLGILLL